MKNGLIIDQDGNKFYYLNDQLHRTNGPAIEYIGGSKAWYLNGKRHRTDGPAIEWFTGSKCWYYHDERIYCNSQKEFEQWLRFRAFQ
jgi:hypothetical protein